MMAAILPDRTPGGTKSLKVFDAVAISLSVSGRLATDGQTNSTKKENCSCCHGETTKRRRGSPTYKARANRCFHSARSSTSDICDLRASNRASVHHSRRPHIHPRKPHGQSWCHARRTRLGIHYIPRGKLASAHLDFTHDRLPALWHKCRAPFAHQHADSCGKHVTSLLFFVTNDASALAER